MMAALAPCLFNFSASYSGGGLKRLSEFARWFDANGGASFIIHPRAEHLRDRFPRNRYFVVRLRRRQRLVNASGYLREIAGEIGTPALYYSYSIPIGAPVGRVNWFHLSNVLPLYSRGVPLPLASRVKFRYLGWLTRRNYAHADVVSAESLFSLQKIEGVSPAKLALSVNGSDDELLFSTMPAGRSRDSVAVVVGTYEYKALWDSYRVFEMLCQDTPGLELLLIGDPAKVPPELASKAGVRVAGIIDREVVIRHLEHATYYISTTTIENSYNAAAEGLFLAAESWISDIGPHRELLQGTLFEVRPVTGMSRSMLRVRRTDASPAILKTWHQVITDMLTCAETAMASGVNGKGTR
jgi:hypothetical protein